MHEKMYNGIEPSYLNVRISPTMPQLCTQEQSFYSNDLHHSPSRDVGGSDSYGSSVSSIGSPDIKSISNLDDSFKNTGGSDKKSIKILQRPSTARSTEGRLHLDGEAPFVNQPMRRGHRKKTLSLDPEEREALESLIEDVIIVGLDDTVIDSDDSFDENDDDKVDDDGMSLEKHSKSFSEGKGLSSDKFLSSRENQRGKIKNNGNGSSLNRSYGGNNGNTNNNSFSKDVMSRRHGKESFKPGQSKNSKDFSRNKEPNFGNNTNKVQKETPKKSFLDCPQEESGDKDRQSITGIIGVNIYPAQLKVAIKHMDSLPPRFLRRLQTGQNRMGGSEPALQSLSELNLNSSQRDSFPRSGNLDSSSGSSEKDRSRSKQCQLEETKKTIRNLLSDLDQYTDEGITTPMSAEESSLGLSSFMPVPPPPPMPMDRSKFEMKAPPMMSPIFRMPHTRYSSESRLDASHPDIYNQGAYYTSPVSFRPDLPQSREFVSLDVAHASSSSGFPCFKPVSDFSGFAGPYDPGFIPQQPQHLLKKTSLKVDAPVFISNQFQRKQDMVNQKSPPIGQGPQMTSTPNKNLENGGIAFLPGVLNADVAQQANLAKKQQLSGTSKSPVSSFGSTGTPHSFKMMHGPVFSPIQQGSHQCGPSLQNGMIQQQPGSMMRMMNFGPHQVSNQVHPGGGHQMNPYSPYAPQNHPSMYMRPPEYPTSVYQPWNCSPPNGDVPSGDAPWFPPMIAPYITHPSMEGGQPSYVVSGDHQGMVPMDMMGQEWKVSLPYGHSDGVLEAVTMEMGRQRALQLLTEGHPVFILLAGNVEGDRARWVELKRCGTI